MDISGWMVLQWVDWVLVWVEMNGYDFNECILCFWVRDFVFYKLFWIYRFDVFVYEGLMYYYMIEIWIYVFLLSILERVWFIKDFKVIFFFNK